MISFLLIIGCSHDPATVLVKELRTPPKITRGAHIVRHGETLYSIAWLYNRDFNELAQVNSIGRPYVIHPGQTLSLSSPKALSQKALSQKALSQKALSQKARSASHTAKSKPVRANPVAINKQQSIKKQTAETAKKNSLSYFNSRWRWPTDGRIVTRYSLKVPVNKGIDISGKLGEPVRAAESGEVVYAGSELTGYGRLIILKHNSSYLSAYAHNKELFVREGDSVKAGQKIAEIGSTGTTEPKLHFEIRRNGKPVDPMGYLPKR